MYVAVPWRPQAACNKQKRHIVNIPIKAQPKLDRRSGVGGREKGKLVAPKGEKGKLGGTKREKG